MWAGFKEQTVYEIIMQELPLKEMFHDNGQLSRNPRLRWLIKLINPPPMLNSLEYKLRIIKLTIFHRIL